LPASKKTEHRICALYGSPRQMSLSSHLHDSFLEPFEGSWVIERFRVYEMNIHPCTACGFCHKENSCIFDDDMNDIYRSIRTSDIISISSPLYFSSLPGPLKTVIDRCQVFWEESTRLENRSRRGRGYFLCTAGSNYPEMFAPALTIIRHFFNSLLRNHTESNYLLVSDTESLTDGVFPERYTDIARQTGLSYKIAGC
jgi:multimeric flavodoxin WrbA